MFWVAIVIFAAGVILYILELSDSKAYKAFTGAISTLAAIVAIISAINPYWIDSLLPENTVGESELTHKGIAYMEGIAGRRFSSLINVLERIRAFLPW